MNITTCNFNNNNGLEGGLFYVNGNSPIYVYNSSFYNNFALVAPISYTSSQGSVHFIGSNFTFNHAVSVGLFETIDSNVESSIEHCEVYNNEMVTVASLIVELEDRTQCKNLCFASDSYFDHLNANRDLLDFVVSWISISRLHTH